MQPVAIGNERSVFASMARRSVEWAQRDANQLSGRRSMNRQIITATAPAQINQQSCLARSAVSEGYLEAFATLYREVADAIVASRQGRPPGPETLFPTVDDGVKGLAFIDAAIRSSIAGGVWTRL